MFASSQKRLIPFTSRDRNATRRRNVGRPRVEDLEGRALLATLMPVANVSVPAYQGYQVALDGGAGNAQTYSVTSDNPAIQASVAQGKFWTVGVNHTSSGSGDLSFNGSMTFQLFEDLTPTTTSRIETLTNQGFYTGKNFHRIAGSFPGPTDFIVQGGSVNGDGTGEVNQPGFPFADEFVQQLAFTGENQLAMANAGDDTNSSQFFVTTGSPTFLNYQHTIFGQLVSGQQTLDQMTQVARNGTTPVTPVLITAASLSPTSPDGVVHIDTSTAAPGETATITVTATDPSDNSTTTQTFRVTVGANSGQNRPFLQPVDNQVVGLIATTPTNQGQTAVFELSSVNPNPPGTAVQYTVRGGVSAGSFTDVQNARASVTPSGVVTVTPNPSFVGVINLVVGVGGPTASPTAVGDWDTQTLTLTVTETGEINLVPIATDGTSQAVKNTPSPVQLAGVTANPASSQTLTYSIFAQPEHGTVTAFDAATGQFTYVPDTGFEGTDTVQFRVTDVGAPLPNLTSTVATQTIVVGGGDTGAVRLIGRVLVVSPSGRLDSVPNTVEVTLMGDQVRVMVNGQLDAIQPSLDELDRLVVYGSTSDDIINVAPDVPLPATLNGGRGGTNSINAGGGPTRGHVWFGRNTFAGGRSFNEVVGGVGKFRVRRMSDGDRVVSMRPIWRATLHAPGKGPIMNFYRIRNGILVPGGRGRV